MRINTSAKCTTYTHEGAPSTPLKPIDALRRSVMACMLWEDTFYEGGIKITERIAELIKQCKTSDVVNLTREVHKKGLLRHMPLFMLVEILKKKDYKAEDNISGLIYDICTRPDQMTELLAMYWQAGKCPLAKQLKKGLAKAFMRFDAYQLAKWNKQDKIKLRDVLFLCHAKPKDDAQATLWKQLVDNTLPAPDTWERRLSAGEDKKESFGELLEKKKLGLMAILMNMRNMKDAGVSKELVKGELLRKAQGTPILPFKYLSASKHCPEWEPIIDEAMITSCAWRPKLPGKTHVFVDVSGSMDATVSAKSELKRYDAAAAFAILLRECCDDVAIHTFSNYLCLVPPRQGMALRDAIIKSQPMRGTDLCAALNAFMANVLPPYDRIIVITDEQIYRALPRVPCDKKYILNVACYQNGIGNSDGWLTISGFSEASIDYIREVEGLGEQ